MIRTKICGISTKQDAQAAIAVGVDAIGLNFVGGSRRIDTTQAEEILQVVTPPVSPVALVECAEILTNTTMQNLFKRFGLEFLQLYGQTTASVLAQLTAKGFKSIIVCQVDPDSFPNNVQTILDSLGESRPEILLLDAFHKKLKGGTGKTADWASIKAAADAGVMKDWPRLMLAGGLNPDNVAAAVAQVSPWAVDVSSGVESSVARKDREMMAAFVHNARSGDFPPQGFLQ